MPRATEESPRTRVLIVEDEGIIAHDMERRLIRMGYAVAGIADNGADALSLSEQTQPDIVLMDIVIQGSMDGIETARKLKEQRDIPVIFLTAHSDDATLDHAKRIQPQAYLVKPFEETEMRTSIELAVYRHGAESRIHEQAVSLRALAARHHSIREEERQHIAREIHDRVTQELTLMKLDLSWVARRITHLEPDPRHPAITERLQAVLTTLDTTITAVERLATELRPAILDSLGLPSAVMWQADSFQSRTGIECVVHAQEDLPKLNGGHETALFRILQESLTNVLRHANANRVDIGLGLETGGLSMEITDDGSGIQTAKILDPMSTGLIGMRERVLMFGGEIRFHGNPGKGTTVSVFLPLDKPTTA